MRKLFISPTLCVLVLLLTGCANMPWQKQAVIGYDILAETMARTAAELTARREAGTLSEDDYQKAKVIYNRAVDIFKKMPEAAAIAIDSDSKIKNKQYADLRTKLLNLLTLIEPLLTEKNIE